MKLRRAWLLIVCILIPLISAASQKRYTVGPMVNKMEALGKGLLDDGISYGLRAGYNFDEHMAVELSYDYLYNFVQATVPSKPTTNGQQIMANFLYNVKDDRGFIPYMIFGLGIEKYDNSMGSLKSGGIAGIGVGAHFLIIDPISLRLEFKDVVRFSDVGHTFYWTFGLEYSFGEMERYIEEDMFAFASYTGKKTKEPEEVPAKEVIKPATKREYAQTLKKRYIKKAENKSESSFKKPMRSETAIIKRVAAVTPPPVAVSKPVSTKKTVSYSKKAAPENSVQKVSKQRIETKESLPKMEKRTPVKQPEAVKESVIALNIIGRTDAGIAQDTEIRKLRKNLQTSSKPKAEEPSPMKKRVEAVSDQKVEKSSVTKPAKTVPVPVQTAAAVKEKPAVPPKKEAEKESVKTASAIPEKAVSHVQKKQLSADESCRRDSDEDSIADCKDICKKTPKGWIVDESGCATAIPMLVNFEFDSADLNEKGREQIGRLADYLQSNPNIKVTIEGHTDSIGTIRYNLLLSKKRALKVKNALIDLGVLPDRISIRAYGESRPIASNKTASGRAENRRADVVIIRILSYSRTK